MLLHTINVVEIQRSQVIGLTAFEDNVKGRQNAEDLFKRVIKENLDNVDDKMMDCFLDQGYVHIEEGSICLVKSEK
jgi:hypothetical protein